MPIKQSVSVSDYQAVMVKFDNLSKNIDNACFKFNSTEDRWEVYDVTDDPIVILAHSDNNWE